MSRINTLTKEILGPILLALGFVFYWLASTSLAFAIIVLGLAVSLNEMWRKPITGIYFTIFFLPLTKTLSLPVVGTKFSLSEIFFISTVIMFFLKKELSLKNLFDFSKKKIFLFLGIFVAIALFSGVNASSTTRWLVEFLTYSYLALFFVFQAAKYRYGQLQVFFLTPLKLDHVVCVIQLTFPQIYQS